jgi:hypothetical protein
LPQNLKIIKKSSKYSKTLKTQRDVAHAQRALHLFGFYYDYLLSCKKQEALQSDF